MPKPGQRVIVDGVSFSEILLFPRILLSVTAALQPGRLAVGLLMVAALLSVGRAWDAIGGATVPPRGLLAPPVTEKEQQGIDQSLRRTLAQHGVTPTVNMDIDADGVARQVRELHRRTAAGESTLAPDVPGLEGTLERLAAARAKGPFEACVALVGASMGRIVEGTLALEPGEILLGAWTIVVQLPRGAWQHDRTFTIGFGLFFLLVMTIGGGALARMAACQWARRERISVREGFDFAFRAARHLVLAPVLPLLLAALLGLLIAVLGLLLRLPWVLDVIGGLAYAPGLLLGGLVAFMLLGWLAGLTLLVPAVAVEHCDAADAQQRAFAYCLNRPLHRIGYGITALLGLVVGYLLVSAFAAITLNLTANLFTAFSGDHASGAWLGGMKSLDLAPIRPTFDPPPGDAAAVSVMVFFQHVVRCLVPAWVLAYIFSAGTMVYLLIRRACDGQEIDEIWRPGMVPGTMTPAVALEGWPDDDASAAGSAAGEDDAS